MMKKLLLATVITALSGQVSADFIGLHGKVGVWNAAFTGEVAGLAKKLDRDSKDLDIPSFEERGFEEDNHNFFWLAFEHPVPILPNVRIGFTSMESSGVSPDEITLDYFQDIPVEINGVPTTVNFADNSLVYTEMNMDAFDAVFYWEVLDNWVSLDLGFTVRKLDGEFLETTARDDAIPFEAIPQLQGTCNRQGWEIIDIPINGVASVPGCIRPAYSIPSITPIDITMPLLYTKAQFDLPLSGFYGAVTAQGISQGDNSMLDIDAELGYMFDLTVMEMGAAVGYRYASLKSKDLSDLYSDASLDGFYGSLNIHF